MKKKTLEDFIIGANIIHNNKFSYNNAVYINNKVKLWITCRLHGDFEQSPNSHLRGSGCPTCANIEKLTNKLLSTKEFIEKANAVHKGKYTYEKTEYLGAFDLVTITCPTHGDFKQVASYHTSGNGCQLCAGTKRKSVEEFVTKAADVHGGKYDYSNVKYTNNRNKVKIVCPVHGEFSQVPWSHLSGKGCSNCAGGGFKGAKPAILYFIKFIGKDLYKLGITNKTVRDRFSPSEFKGMQVLYTIKSLNGDRILKLETELLRKYSEYKYTGEPLLKTKGNTEIFSLPQHIKESLWTYLRSLSLE